MKIVEQESAVYRDRSYLHEKESAQKSSEISKLLSEIQKMKAEMIQKYMEFKNSQQEMECNAERDIDDLEEDSN